MQHVENELDITLEKLTQTNTKLDEKEKAYAVAEGEIQALKRSFGRGHHSAQLAIEDIR